MKNLSIFAFFVLSCYNICVLDMPQNNSKGIENNVEINEITQKDQELLNAIYFYFFDDNTEVIKENTIEEKAPPVV